MINSVQTAYRSQSVESPRYNRNNEQVQVQPQKSGDTVSISDSAQKLAKIDSFFTDMNIPYTPGKSISLEDLNIGLEKSSKELNDNINTLFLQNGIKTNPAVELTSDHEGKIRVNNDHPQKDKIEKLFEDNPELANDFRGVSALSSMVKASEEYLEFAAAYDRNPQEAITRFGHMFDQTGDKEFSMVIGMKSEKEISSKA